MIKRVWMLGGPIQGTFGWVDEAGKHERPGTTDEFHLWAEVKRCREWFAHIAISAPTLYVAQQRAREALGGAEARDENGESLVREILPPLEFPPEPVSDGITRRIPFEAWAVRAGLSVKRLPSGRYASSETYWAFEGWFGRIVAAKNAEVGDWWYGKDQSTKSA